MKATTIINELILACQRTKYQEAVIFHQRKRDRNSGNQRRRLNNDSGASRTWTEILRDLCSIMPLVADEEHALISRLLSLCILAYLMPQTCRFLETDPDRAASIQNTDKENNGLTFGGSRLLTLEMVLNRSPQIRHLSSGQFDSCNVNDECISSSFFDFMHNGIGPFLCSRPMSHAISAGCNSKTNCGSADLLHVLSLAISGSVSEDKIVGSDENGNEVNFVFSNRTKTLVAKRQSDILQISAGQRGKLVQVVTNSLVLTKINVPQESSSLLMNGILHFRAALKSFSVGALSIHQVIDARRGLVWSAIDTECFAHFEMKALVASLVSNKAKRFRRQCNCRSVDLKGPRVRDLDIRRRRYEGDAYNHGMDSTLQQQIYYQKSVSYDLCIHCSNGDLLSDLIIRYNGARLYADGTFTSQALAELTVAIATLLGEIENNNETEDVNVSDLPTACTIASVLDATSALFYFLLGDKDKEEVPEAQQLEMGMKGALLECVVQLLGSPDRCVVIASSSLLALAASYESISRVDDMQSKIFARLQAALKNTSNPDDYRDIVEVLARRSTSFAKSVCECLVCIVKKPGLSNEGTLAIALRMLNLVATGSPRIVSSMIPDMQNTIASKMDDENITKQWAALLLTCFGLQYASDESAAQRYSTQISGPLSQVKSTWSRFQLARHALSTAQFQAAHDLFENHLLASTSSASSYIWISCLSLIARSEVLVSDTGVTHLPQAISDLDTAVSKIRSLPVLASFQIEFLSLRKDFLHLCLVATNLCAEIRLTNVIGSRTSRQFLHQKNISKCFYMLGSRYFTLYKRYSFFTCQHTQSTIRSQFALCRFLGDSARKVFNPLDKNSKNGDESNNFPRGDMSRIQARIIKMFRSELIDNIDNVMEPPVRCKIFREVIGTVLKCPNPFPKSFTALKCIPRVSVQVAMKCQGDQNFAALSLEESLPRVQLGTPFQARISGILPETLMTKSLSPFSQIIVTLTFSLTGPLQRDVDAEDLIVDKTSDTEDLTTTATSDLLPNFNANTRFVIDCECPMFQRHGYYNMELKVQLRDVRCGEYELVSSLTEESIVIACKPD